jgi:hypothetical protein
MYATDASPGLRTLALKNRGKEKGSKEERNDETR